MFDNRIGYIICETGLTDVEEKPTIIAEEVTVVPGDEYREEHKRTRVIAESILQTADLKNRNGRIYPGATELFPQLESERTTTLIDHGYLCGEAGHPLDATLVRQQTIDPKLVMSRYIKLWHDDRYVYGRYKGTNNQYGEQLDMDLREGCIPEFSLRALGTLENTREGAVVRNLKMITYDVVIWQSDPNAFTRKILSEAMQLGNSAEEDTILEPISNKQALEFIMQESTNLDVVKESFDLNYDTIRYLKDLQKIQMQDKNGNMMMINLESYIANELIDYAKRH